MPLAPRVSVPPACHATFGDYLAISHGQGTERQLCLVVMDCLMIARACTNPMVGRTWLQVVKQTMLSWNGDRASPEFASLANQFADANRALHQHSIRKEMQT